MVDQRPLWPAKNAVGRWVGPSHTAVLSDDELAVRAGFEELSEHALVIGAFMAMRHGPPPLSYPAEAFAVAA
jgi:hypothetical protein